MNLKPDGPKRRTAAGFSLLEMVVAIAILAMSLGVLYRAVGGATRSVSVDEKVVYAVELARSLLALHAVVPLSGFSDRGETEGGYRWEVLAGPLALSEDSRLENGQLQDITVTVTWADGLRERDFVLQSVVAGEERE